MGGFILISTCSTGSNGAALTNVRKASVSAFCSGVSCGGWFCASAGVEMRTTIIANTEKRTSDIWKSSPCRVRKVTVRCDKGHHAETRVIQQSHFAAREAGYGHRIVFAIRATSAVGQSGHAAGCVSRDQPSTRRVAPSSALGIGRASVYRAL
jgi:hypothetical protein